MEANQINRAIHRLGRIPDANEVLRGYRLEVCEVDQDAWNAFVESEDQALRSRLMAWIDNKVFIVEFPSGAHDVFASALGSIVQDIPNTRDSLTSRRGTYLESGPRYEADESYGPKRGFAVPRGIQPPAGIDHWRDYMTLKVEVGVSRAWGTTPGYLDWKATRAWRDVPGVAFVLCIAVDSDLQHASYKMY